MISLCIPQMTKKLKGKNCHFVFLLTRDLHQDGAVAGVLLCIDHLRRCCQRVTLAYSPRPATWLWTPSAFGMTFPALSLHPPVASRRGASWGTAHGFVPCCLPFLFVLKAQRGECYGLINFKQNQQQQRKLHCKEYIQICHIPCFLY